MQEKIRELRDTIETCNLNFLVGSGLSSPYLETLGNIEVLLTRLEETPMSDNHKQIIKCSLYKRYFDGVISKNCKILQGDEEADSVLNGYYEFLKLLNSILLRRKSTIVGKEANLFTTNIDVFLEKAVERIGLECNDGFSGRFEPWFATSNFRKTHFKKSPQYDNVSELPTINLLKLHGSLTWQVKGTDTIVFSRDLAQVQKIQANAITPALVLDICKGVDIQTLVAACEGKIVDATAGLFLSAYDDLLIVNPTKAKFRDTLLNQTHYELLRIYSNELEKENTILIAMGFSFADEHIRQMTLRAANSNPTLMIYVIAYDSTSAAEIRGRFPILNTRNNNIIVLAPEVNEKSQDRFHYNLPTINQRILGQLLSPDNGHPHIARAPV